MHGFSTNILNMKKLLWILVLDLFIFGKLNIIKGNNEN